MRETAAVLVRAFGGVVVADGDLMGGWQVEGTFPNGYSVSIINHRYSYGLEMAVLRGGELVYDTPVTDDVLGHLDEDSLREAVKAVSLLEGPVKA